jgi:hypothetical protein
MTAHPMSFYGSSHLEGAAATGSLGLFIEGIFKDFTNAHLVARASSFDLSQISGAAARD